MPKMQLTKMEELQLNMQNPKYAKYGDLGLNMQNLSALFWGYVGKVGRVSNNFSPISHFKKKRNKCANIVD